MDFKVSSTTIEDTGLLLVSVDGELDIATAERLVDPAEVAVSVGCPLILDLSECSFIDSAGLRIVLRIHEELAEAGEEMALTTDRPQPRKVLSLTKIDRKLRVFATRDEAIMWLGRGGAKVDAAEPSLNAATNGGPSLASPHR